MFSMVEDAGDAGAQKKGLQANAHSPNVEGGLLSLSIANCYKNTQ